MNTNPVEPREKLDRLSDGVEPTPEKHSSWIRYWTAQHQAQHTDVERHEDERASHSSWPNMASAFRCDKPPFRPGAPWAVKENPTTPWSEEAASSLGIDRASVVQHGRETVTGSAGPQGAYCDVVHPLQPVVTDASRVGTVTFCSSSWWRIATVLPQVSGVIISISRIMAPGLRCGVQRLLVPSYSYSSLFFSTFLILEWVRGSLCGSGLCFIFLSKNKVVVMEDTVQVVDVLMAAISKAFYPLLDVSLTSASFKFTWYQLVVVNNLVYIKWYNSIGLILYCLRVVLHLNQRWIALGVNS